MGEQGVHTPHYCLSVVIFLSLQWKFLSQISQLLLEPVFYIKLESDELYCVTKEQPHIAYQSLYLFIFLSLQYQRFLNNYLGQVEIC